MMKELAGKAFKFIGASIGVLVAAYTVGWSGAMTLHNLFRADRVEAETFVTQKITDTKNEIMAIHSADMTGLKGQIDILVTQNNLIISQNYRTRKIIETKIK